MFSFQLIIDKFCYIIITILSRHNPINKILTENDLEGKAFITPIQNEQVLNYIREQSGNLKFIKECFDFVYKDIVVNEAGTKVYLTTNEGNTLVVPIESYIHNELMNYATNRLNQ
jgi:hypothetical protein